MISDKPDKQIIKEAIEENLQENGWAPLAKVGFALRKRGINNYERLTSFLMEYSDIVEIEHDESLFSRVSYVRIKGENAKSFSVSPAITNQLHKKTFTENLPIQHEINSGRPGKALKDWAWLIKSDTPREELSKDAFQNWMFDEFQNTIAELKSKALEERWFFNRQDKVYPFPILEKYLIYTFYRLTQEKNKICYVGKYATFNTGLVDYRYQPIYALFEKNESHRINRSWRLVDFCIAGEDSPGKTLVKYFPEPLPQPAYYFYDNADRYYNPSAKSPKIDLKHIVIENIERLPILFLKEHAPKSFEFKDVSTMAYYDRQIFFDNLRLAIEKDKNCERYYINRINDALELSLKRVQWNWKTAIPMYFPTFNTMSMLLPLCLINPDKVDIALVTQRTPSGNYLGHTILSLEMAYSNARLVSRPDSDWLIADQIEAVSYTDQEIE